MSRRQPNVPIAGRTAVITGAGSGIGRAVALRLSGQGSPVVLVDQNEEGLEETAAATSSPTLVRKLDVRDRQALMALAAEVDGWKPAPLGMVFNNAGVTVMQGVADSSPEDDEWVLDINLGGVVNGVRAFLPLLLRQDSGAIVNTSSVFGLVGFPHQSAYCASKFAVRGYTDALRQELRRTGVSAVNVHPGGVKTNIVKNARFRGDHRGQWKDLDSAAVDFEAMAQTTPDKAARIIQAGVESGKARIRVGADAVFFDLIGRVAPTRYYDVLERLEGGVDRFVKLRTSKV